MASAPPPIPAPRGRPRKQPIADMNLLSFEEQQKIREEVARAVELEKAEVARKAFREQALEEARRAGGIEEELVTFTLDLAEFADRLVIDGVIYFHGRTYTVPMSAFKSMAEMAFRTHGHQLELDGKSRIKHVSRNQGVSPHGIINTSNLMRA